MKIRVLRTCLHVLNMRARMPFRYGIATMTALPHLFVSAEVELDGRRQSGVAADGLAPKWFTKDPKSAYKDDLLEMLRAIQSACSIAERAGAAGSVFELWQTVYAEQKRWAASAGPEKKFPPLLWGFGVSLIERAVIDAFCRATQTPFAQAVRANTLGLRLGAIHTELEGASPADFLPAAPLRSIIARHTVGLSDPLTDDDVAPDERLADGLPKSLESCIREYGLTHFKIKLLGDVPNDLARLKRLSEIIARGRGGSDFGFTLDGNENFRDVEPFQALWEQLAADASLKGFLSRLIFVEQPLHRGVALGSEVRAALARWKDRPPIIIDESDASLDSLPLALECGYSGSSHKNCKGIFKGIANACLIARRSRLGVVGPASVPATRLIVSGEDLCNTGPVALLQDMAVLATLGIEHAERNGHHYFKGLSMFPADVQETLLAAHGDLYARASGGFPTLRIERGWAAVGSVVDAPFGCAFDIDPARFTPLEKWSFESL